MKQIMIVYTTMLVRLLCVHSHCESSYETILWNCRCKVELLHSGSRVDGCGLEDCLLVPRRHIGIFLFTTISGLTGGHVMYLEPFLWSGGHSCIPSVANTMNVWSSIWALLCDVMWWSLGTEPSGLDQKRKALDGKPGANTVIFSFSSFVIYAISYLGRWSPHRWPSWGTVNIQGITTVTNLYSWEYINPSQCTYNYKRKRMKQTWVQQGSSLTVITVLIMIVHCIHYEISLTQQTDRRWLSINLSSK